MFRDMRNNGISPTADIVKNEINKRLNLQHIKDENTFFGFVEKLIKECEPLKKPNTIKAYKTTLSHLQNFSTSANKFHSMAQ